MSERDLETGRTRRMERSVCWRETALTRMESSMTESGEFERLVDFQRSLAAGAEQR